MEHEKKEIQRIIKDAVDQSIDMYFGFDSGYKLLHYLSEHYYMGIDFDSFLRGKSEDPLNFGVWIEDQGDDDKNIINFSFREGVLEAAREFDDIDRIKKLAFALNRLSSELVNIADNKAKI
jgi:hypothetical protein